VADFLLPDLGEGLSEAEVIAWRVAPGDRVAVDQVIPGAVVSVGQPLITVTEDAVPREPGAGFREPGVVVPAQVPAAADGGEEASGSVLIGYGTTVAPARTRRGRRRNVAAVSSEVASPAVASPAVVAEGQRPGRVAVISPLVRKEARDAGLDLARLTATGPDGVVSRQDVRAAIAARTSPRQPAAVVRDEAVTTVAGAATTATIATAAGAGERRIPLRGARRAVADKLSRSRREIPEATVWVDVDATGLVDTRRAMNAADPSRPVSLLALLARFTILGLRRYPELNARIEQDEIIVPAAVNLGFAAQTDHGLVVPVVADARQLTTRELSARLAGLTAAARDRRLSPADLTGGTFTVNNYGVFGVDGSAAIINHPEVAILGMGRVMDRPWVVDGELTVRKVTELTLSFDHRACDGGTAGGFLRYVADCIESPASALGDM